MTEWPVAKDAAKALVRWIKSPRNRDWAANNNFTVAVYGENHLVVTQVGGMAGGSRAAEAIKRFIVAKKMNVGRKLYWAGPFSAKDGPTSNHAEMCILAACGAPNIKYIECTSPNCIFCQATLEDYGLAKANGNARQGVGKTQIGWRHPFAALTYGAARAQGPNVLEELRAVNKELRNGRPLPEIAYAVRGYTQPKQWNLTQMEFPTDSESEEEGEGENDVSASEEESESEDEGNASMSDNESESDASMSEGESESEGESDASMSDEESEG